ncbi:MAG TPA: STAS domain-containing protein [Terriglobia bacterium]|jgi:anti-anti-sigma factor|nr:STAS domain-containing protein [Terriglobia bacterium]
MLTEKLVITSELVGDHAVRVLKLSGPILLSNLFDFQALVRSDDSAILVLDLSEVPYMDSAAVGCLVNAHVSRVNHHRHLALAGVHDRVATLMQATHIDQVLKTFPTVAEALTVAR